MVELGYALSSEEHQPDFLVSYAKMAEDSAFTFAFISVHRIGPDQEGFMKLYMKDVLPRFN